MDTSNALPDGFGLVPIDYSNESDAKSDVTKRDTEHRNIICKQKLISNFIAKGFIRIVQWYKDIITNQRPAYPQDIVILSLINYLRLNNFKIIQIMDCFLCRKSDIEKIKMDICRYIQFFIVIDNVNPETIQEDKKMLDDNLNAAEQLYKTADTTKLELDSTIDAINTELEKISEILDLYDNPTSTTKKLSDLEHQRLSERYDELRVNLHDTQSDVNFIRKKREQMRDNGLLKWDTEI